MDATNMIVNRAHLKRFVKDWCAANRPKFTRCSEDFVERMDATLKRIVVEELHKHPSKGKTIA